MEVRYYRLVLFKERLVFVDEAQQGLLENRLTVKVAKAVQGSIADIGLDGLLDKMLGINPETLFGCLVHIVTIRLLQLYNKVAVNLRL